jgi:hypothetical protein
VPMVFFSFSSAMKDAITNRSYKKEACPEQALTEIKIEP